MWSHLEPSPAIVDRRCQPSGEHVHLPLYLAPNSERVSLRLNLLAPQLPKCSADLLEVAVVLAVEPDVPVENCPVPSYLEDILVLPLGVRTPDHLKSR